MPPIQPARPNVAAPIKTPSSPSLTPVVVGREPLQGPAIDTLKEKMKRDTFDGASPLPTPIVMQADAKKTASAKLPPDVAAFLKQQVTLFAVPERDAGDGAANIQLAQKQIAKGDYTSAAGTLAKANTSISESTLGSQVGLETVQKQVEFLAGMQAKGVKADYPPTEAQLVKYFETLKGDPNAARAALAVYTKEFHVHPANVPGAKNDKDIKYVAPEKGVSKDLSPHNWSDVANRPADGELNVGKQINDCEGFAFISEKLLEAAGFEVKGHVTGLDPRKKGPKDDPASSHEMMLFKHPNESRFTVTSNEGVFTNASAKAAAQEGFKAAVGQKANALFLGSTGFEAGKNLVNENNPLK